MSEGPSSAEIQINNLIYECDDILSDTYGDNTQSHIDDLMVELEGFRHQMSMTGADDITSDNTRHGVLKAHGWLCANLSSLTSPPINSITNSSQSIASVRIDINQTIEQVQSSELSQSDKDALELAISRMRNAAEQKDEKGFADKLSKALDIASKGAGLVPQVVQAASQLAGLF